MSEHLLACIDFEAVASSIDTLNLKEPKGITEKQFLEIENEVKRDITFILINGFMSSHILLLFPQHFMNILPIFLGMSYQSLKNIYTNSKIKPPTQEQKIERQQFIEYCVTPIVKDCVLLILQNADDWNFTDTEIQHAILDLQKFFHDNGWGDNFDMVARRYPYIWQWLHYKHS